MDIKNYFLFSDTIKNYLMRNDRLIDDYVVYIDKCPLCGSGKIKGMFEAHKFNYLRCKNCFFVFSNPRLTDKGASIWYNTDYYNAAMKTEHYIAKNFNKFYSASLSQFHFDKAIDLIKRQNFDNTTKIIDLGCGSGAILSYLKDRLLFNNLLGIDLNSSNIEFSKNFRNIEIKNIDLYELGKKEKYDLIITTENIEHVSEPDKYIELINSISHKGTCLLLTTPHNDKKATTLMGPSGDHFCAPNHQNYFNSQNLSHLLNQNGFEVIDYFIDDTTKFSIYSFVKRFFIDRDQITSYPPSNARLKTIWKWQKNTGKSIVFKEIYSEFDIDKTVLQIPQGIVKKIKYYIKKASQVLPIKFHTHIIILAKKL